MTMEHEDKPTIPERISSRRDDSGIDDDVPKPPKFTRNQALTLLGLIIAISFFVSLIWGNTQLVSRSVYETDITNIVNDIGTMQGSVTNATNQVKSVSDTINNINTQYGSLNDKVTQLTNDLTSTKSAISGFIKADSLTPLKTDITSIQNSINNLQSQVGNIKQMDTTALSTGIDTLKAQVSDIQDRILILEQGGVSTGEYNPLTVEIKTLANTLALSQATSTNGDTTTTTNVLSGSIRLSVKNASSVDVDDALLDVMFSFSPSIPNVYYGSGVSVSLTGGSIPFTAQVIDPNMLEFYNSAWGFKVSGNQKTTLILNLKISYLASRDNNTTAYNPWNWQASYYYQVDAEVTR